jgi:imidazolonepropionase
MNMACTLFRMTPEEALAGAPATPPARWGLADAVVIAPGMRADLAIWDVDAPGGAVLPHRIQPPASGFSEAR